MTNSVETEMNVPLAPVVYAKGGEVYATSRDVAAYFEKQHKHVLDSIAALISQEPNLLRAEDQGDHGSKIRPMITTACFEEILIEVAIGRGATRMDRAYAMTRKGFTVLAMRFTGPRALRFQLQYIDAFEMMEAELRNAAAGIDPSRQEIDDDKADWTERREWMKLISLGYRTGGKALAQRIWKESSLPQIDPEPVPDETSPAGLLIGFIQEKCKVTGDPTAFLKARVLLTSARSYAQEKGVVWPGDRRMSLALRHLCAVYADPDSGAKFWPVKRSDSGYCGIRMN
ncbi:Rha family transcriptional regulator [Salipiger thiooxidans]|uniref:Rha family transcriptional regulator n=1 Tax=Salipiger thiooxidans TaxID=282683 RepID=UPI001CD1B61E|nr:Rha family transcriptional regulator [Salipiger thiooxidans]MCA0851226.1 Rha family transcriptional regulator [Salipiger thiooxidans]